MKKITPYTTASFILSVISIGLTFYQYKFTSSNFEYRIAASTVGVIAFFSVAKEFMRYTGYYQFAAFFVALLSLGISIDNIFHAPPYITLSLMLIFLASHFNILFRSRFSEGDHLWMGAVLWGFSLLLYFYGNISLGSGWREWVFPVPVYLFCTYFTGKSIVEGKMTVNYVSNKKLIHEAGKAAPDFCLRDYEGIEVKLSDYTGKRDVLLMFVRNAWCPSCHIMLRTYQRNKEKFKEKNVLLFAIGPDVLEVNKQMAIDLGIDFKVLSDEKQKTAMDYRVHLPSEFVGEQYAEGMPLPASFLIDKKGIIRYSSRPDRIGEFFNPETIFPVLESLN
ncbi:MAG: peroxiredoxin family protein [Bacteroidia bacterium]